MPHRGAAMRVRVAAVERAAHGQAVVRLVAGQGLRRGGVESAAGERRVGHVPEPPQVVLHGGDRGMRLAGVAATAPP